MGVISTDAHAAFIFGDPHKSCSCTPLQISRRILKLARTIADLEVAPQIGNQHLAVAIQYRSLDRRGID